jgi:hypothetical protein
MYENHEEQSSGPPPPHEFYGQQSHQQQPPSERKSPVTATLLSCMPGLGQVYVGYYQRGFVNIAVAAGVIFLLNQYELREFQPLLGVFLPFFWIYNMIDAARCAQAVNRGAEAGIHPELPALPAAMGGGGSVFAGVVLVALGMLFLARTVLGFSLAWLAEWWPVFLILFGARMIFAGRSRQRDGGGSSLE